MDLYVVTAYRFGDKERHSYVVGAFTNEDLAMQVANSEEDFRGGKYSCRVLKVIVDYYDDQGFLHEVIKEVNKTV